MARTFKDRLSANKKYKSSRQPPYCKGPGGVDCVCCFPAPGSTERRKLIKSFRRRQTNVEIRLSCEEINLSE